ncbi:MAG: site-2 protease family protein [Bacteroidota bacterium]
MENPPDKINNEEEIFSNEEDNYISSIQTESVWKNAGRILFHSILFVTTFFTVTVAGVQWLNKNPFDLQYIFLGLPYAIALLGIITAHEFGHYFAAKYHNVKTTLPYFIPMPSFLFNPFGTMGAIIRIKEPIRTKKALFDIGIAGPVAGLVVTVFVLLFGLMTLPEKEFLYSVHPEYVATQIIPISGLTLGKSLFFYFVSYIGSSFAFFPPMNEIYHYHFLNAAWFGLFITSMNLIPVGQLDGGHILYALIGRKQGFIARTFLIFLVLIGLGGVFAFIEFDSIGGTGWLLWAVILFFFVKPDHPEVHDTELLDGKRRFLGWFIFVVFLLTFTPVPFFELAHH